MGRRHTNEREDAVSKNRCRRILSNSFHTIHTIHAIHYYSCYSCDVVGLLNDGQLDRGEAGGVEVRVERLHVERCVVPLRLATAAAAAAAAIALCVGVEVSVDEDIVEILLHLENRERRETEMETVNNVLDTV